MITLYSRFCLNSIIFDNAASCMQVMPRCSTSGAIPTQASPNHDQWNSLYAQPDERHGDRLFHFSSLGPNQNCLVVTGGRIVAIASWSRGDVTNYWTPSTILLTQICLVISYLKYYINSELDDRCIGVCSGYGFWTLTWWMSVTTSLFRIVFFNSNSNHNPNLNPPLTLPNPTSKRTIFRKNGKIDDGHRECHRQTTNR